VLEGAKVEVKVLYTDRQIVNEVKKVKPSIVAIDAPLSLPKGRKSLAQRGKPHLRECDRALLKMGIKFFPLTLGPMRKLTRRGIKLKEKLEEEGFEVIEVFPGAAQDLWGIPRVRKNLEGLRNGLERLGIRCLSRRWGPHELDAITSAMVGKLYKEKSFTALGDPKEGLIIIPFIKDKIL
jgi:hypothetical protein